MERYALIECFKDTCRRVAEDAALNRATRAMQAGTRLYLPGFEALMPVEKREIPAISVMEDTTFHCAQGFLGEGKIAVLNFANAYTPGGGVAHGAMAQEECLCRSSNLYQGLTLRYLMRNYYKYNARNVGDLGTDAVIYHPGVTVIKSDDALPAPLEQPFCVDVLTCAAPYVNPDRKRPVPPDELAEAFGKRVKNILEVAAANDVDVLILGAFGCGAFNNPPEMAAGCFRDYLVDQGYGRYFKRVVFAIKRGGVNYRTFKMILEPDA